MAQTFTRTLLLAPPPALWEDVPHCLDVVSAFLILPFTVVKTC